MAGVAKFCSPLHTSVRGFRTTARRLKDATPAEVKGTPYNKLNIGVPAETWTNEKRVACTPAVTAMLTKKGFTVNVQEGAGKLSSFRDDDFAAAGAKIVSKEAAFQQDITLKLRQPSMEETKLFRCLLNLLEYLNHLILVHFQGRGHFIFFPLSRTKPRSYQGLGREEAHCLRHGLRPQNLQSSGL